MANRKIKISEILEMVQNGMTRPEIKKELDLSNKEMKVIFSHEKLKKTRAHSKPVEIVLVDDTAEDFQEEEKDFDLETQEGVEAAVINGDEELAEVEDGLTNPQ